MTAMFLPSPPISAIHLGPLTIHFYALCILAGIAVAWWWARRRFEARGGRGEDLETILTVAVIAGIVGARVYHVVTDPQLFFGPGRDPWDAVKIWQGGLGIVGGVVFGAAVVWWMCRRRGYSFSAMADVIAPTLLVAQAVGRLGNWFNQELFGRPTTLPWGLQIDPAHRPDGYEQFATFHPTFLYELAWNLLGALVLVQLERRLRLGHGRVFCAYVMWYAFGRFWIEGVRIDPANQAGGLRVNEWVMLALFTAALEGLVVIGLRHRGIEAEPFGAGSRAERSDADATDDHEPPEGESDAQDPVDERPGQAPETRP